MIGWIVTGLIAAVFLGAVLRETFGPFVKSILDRYVYRYFKCFVKWVRGKFFGEVELDGRTTYTQEIPEEEVPEEFRYVKYCNGIRVDVSNDENLKMMLRA